MELDRVVWWAREIVMIAVCLTMVLVASTTARR